MNSIFSPRFLHEQESVFHPNHHTMLDVKMHLSLLYGNLKMYSILQMNRPQLERKQQCLKDVLSTLNKGNLLRGIDIWSGIMNYKFLTTETNSKALNTFRCFLTQPHQ